MNCQGDKDVKRTTVLVIFILNVVLSACTSKYSGDDDGGYGETPRRVRNPWSGIDSGTPSSDNTQLQRGLVFNDNFVILYDGSAASGTEETCRREVMVDGDGNDAYYEVCMTLEDDPYFVTLESTFVWHPLMFERFATELSCYSWKNNEARGMEDCAVVYDAIGEEGFLCEAGLVNGDKALRCSDDWAVVVNGRTYEAKTVCRVHLSNGIGRCLGAPKEGATDADLVLNMQRTSWEGYRSGQENSEQFGVGDSGNLVLPRNAPAGAVLSYSSEDETVCQVDNDDSDGGVGTIMISPGVSPPTTCRIYLLVEAEGFVERVLFVDIPILQESSIQWDNYVRSNNYFYPGERLSAEPVTSSATGTMEKTFVSLDETICTVNEDTGEVTAVAFGECVIRLTVKIEDYLDQVIDRIIPVDALKVMVGTIGWSDFDSLDSTVSTAQVGGTSTLTDPLIQATEFDGTPVPGLTSSIKHTSGDCDYSYDGSNHNIEFTGVTECVLTVTATSATGRGFENLVAEFRYTPGLGTFVLNWGGYGSGSNSVEYGSSAPPTDSPTTNPADLEVTLAFSASGGGCDVDGDSGLLSIVGADNTETGSERGCVVTLTAIKDGYEEQSQSYTVTINKKSQGDLTATNPYGGAASLENGATLEIVNHPTGGVGEVVYGLSSGSCSVTENTGAVTAEASSGNCVIKAYWSGDENNEASAEVNIATIAMVASSSDAPVWSTSPYGSNPAVDGTPVPIAGNAITNVSSGIGALEYESGTPEVCSVAADGALSGVAAGVDACIVRTRFSGDATNGASSWSDSSAITVEKGTHPALTGSNYYGANPEVPANGTLELETTPEGQGIATYSLKNGSSVYCDVNSQTGRVSGVSTTINPNDCVIQVAFDGGDNYNPLVATDLQSVVVTDGIQEITISEPYGREPNMAVGDTLRLVTPPVSVQGGVVSYHAATVTSEKCRVAVDGTITALAAGTCTVEINVATVSGYLPIVNKELANVLVDEGSFSFVWNPYKSGEEYRVGNEPMIEEVNTGATGANVIYEVANDGDTDCNFKGESGDDATTLTFESHGLCTLRATASKEHYRDWSIERSIRVRPGVITVTAGSFADMATLVVGAESPIVPVGTGTPNPTDARVFWELIRGEEDCTLDDPVTGAVRARAVEIDAQTVCSLKLVAELENYETYRSDPIEIPLAEGAIGSLTTPIYGVGGRTNLPLGGTLELTEAPQAASGLAVSVDSVLAVGTDSGDQEKADVCSVNGQGDISAGSSAVATDKCIVTFTMNATGYESEEVAFTLTLVENSFVFTSAPVLTYGGDELQVGGAALSVTSALPATDNSDTPVSVTWEYWVEGRDSDDALKDGVCIVGSNGEVSAGDEAEVGDSCHVVAVGTATGHVDTTVRSAKLDIVSGDLLFADSTNKASYNTSLNLGGELSPIIPNGGNGIDDNGVEVTWGQWRVEELTPGSSGNVPKDDVCSVDSDGVVSTASAAAVGDLCHVYGVASNPNYNDSDEFLLGEVTMAPKAMLDPITGPAYSELLALRGLPIEITTLPDISGVSAEITWTYSVEAERNGGPHSPSSEVCSVDSNNGTVTLGTDARFRDECKIIATANAPGYLERTARGAEVTNLLVHDTFTSLSWGITPSGYAVGQNFTIGRPTTVPTTGDGDITITKVAGDCNWNGYSELNFDDLTECTLRVTGSKDYFVPLTRDYRVVAIPGAIAVTWNAYGTVVVDGETNPPALTGLSPNDVEKTYSLAEGSSGCNVDEGVVTGISAGTDNCKIELLLTHDAYESKKYVYTISVGQGTQTLDWDDAYGENPTIAVGGVGISPEEPVPTGGGSLKYKVATADSSKCRVDGDGLVTAELAGEGSTCAIEAQFVGNDDYDTSPWVVIGNIAINSGTITGVDWPAFALTGTVGVEKTLPEVTGHDNLTDMVSYVKSSGPCDITGRVLTFTNSGSCLVKATVARSGYTTWDSRDRTIVVAKGTIDGVSWPVFPLSGTVGAEKTLPAVTGMASATDADAYVKVSGDGCLLDSRTLTFSDSGDCVVKATVTRTGYNTWNSRERTITVSEGTITLTSGWGSYGAVRVGANTAASNVVTVPAVVNKNYSLANNSSGCRLGSLGSVIGETPGSSNCKIKLVLSKTGYGTKENTYTISVQEGIWSGVSWDGYTGEAVFGSPPPTRENPSSTPVATWGYGTSSPSSVCEIHSTSGALTINGAGSCVVTAIPSKTHYETHTGVTVSVSIDEGSQDAPSGFSDHYGANPSVRVTENISVSGVATIPTNDISGGGSLEYHVKSGGCSVNPTTGEVTAESLGPACEIEARFAGVQGKYDPSDYEDVASITITAATQSFTWSPSTVQAAYGTELVLDALTVPNDADDTYHIGDTGNTAGCDWKGGSGAHARTLTFANDGVCNVNVQVTRPGFHGWTSPPVTITATPLSWTTAPAWSGYSDVRSRYRVGDGPLTPDNPTSTPPADSWSYSTDSASSICTVNEDTGVLTIVGSGGCHVRATPSKVGYGTGEHEGILVGVVIDKHTQNPPSWTDPYGVDPQVVINGTLPLDSGSTVDVGEGRVSYRVAPSTGEYCEVGESSGEVTPLMTGANRACLIQAQFVGNSSYSVSPWGTIASIDIVPASSSGLGFTWSPPSTGVRAETITLSQYGVTNSLDSDMITYNKLRGNCTLTGASLYLAGTGECTVRVTVERTGYGPWTSPEKTITMSSPSGSQMSFGSTPALSYTGNLILGNTSESAQFGALPVKETAGNSGVTWTFSVQGFAGNGTTPKMGVCALASANPSDANHRKVTLGSSAAQGDFCVVTAIGAATGYDDYRTLPVRLTVLGQLAFSDRSGVPQYPHQQTIPLRLSDSHFWPGASVAPGPVPPGGYRDSSGVLVTWGNWRVSSVTNNSGGALTDGEICSVDANGTVNIGSSSDVQGSVCTIEAVASADGYLDKTLDEIVVVNISRTAPQAAPNIRVGAEGLSYTGSDGELPEALVAGHPDSDYRFRSHFSTSRHPAGGGGNGSLEYHVDRVNACGVHHELGSVTAYSPGPCTILVRWTGTDSGTASSPWAIAWSFQVRRTQSAPDINIEDGLPYGGVTMRVGDTVSVVNTAGPTGGDNDGIGYGNLEYFLKKSPGCTVDSATGTVTASALGDCNIRVRWAGNTEYGPSAWATIWETTIVE